LLHWLGLLLDNRAFVLTTPLEKEARLSQSQLAEETGIPVKTIQQYEQRRKDINKAQAEVCY
jgi:DNA-binding XRE family transcriptional regulator